MADTRRPSLTVMNGPLAGTEFVIEDAVANVLIGSDETSGFVLDLPGVSPIHARVWVDAQGITVYDTNSPRGVYVNDDRVKAHAPLKHGDVLWLGYPGDDESVMLQLKVAGAGPVGAAPLDVTDASATVAFNAAAVREQLAQPPPPVEPAPAEEPVETFVVDEGPSPEPTVAMRPGEDDLEGTVAMPAVAPEPEPGPEPELDPEPEPVVEVEPTVAMASPREAEPEPEIEPTVAMRPPMEAEIEPTVSMPPPVERTGSSDMPFDEGEATVLEPADAEETVLEPPKRFSVEPPAASDSPKPAFEEDVEETVSDAALPAAAAAAARAVPPPPAVPTAHEDAGRTVVIEPTPTVAMPPPPVAPPSRAPGPPPAAAKVTGARPKPPPSRPSAAPQAAVPPAARKTPSRAAPSRTSGAVPVASPPAAPARPAGGSRGPLIGLGVAAAALIGLGLWWMSRGGESPAPSPTLAAAPGGAAPAAIATPAAMAPANVPRSPVPIPIEEEVTIVRSTPSAAPTAAAGAPSPSPRVAQNVPPLAPVAPPPVTAPAAPAPGAQIPTLMQQAQSVGASGNYDGAIAIYDQVLSIEPGHAGATAGKKSAAALKKSFVAGRTVVETEKARGGPAGFESEDVKLQKAPDFQGRLEYAIDPPRVKPGDNYKLQVFLVNEGKKEIRVQSLTVNQVVNGQKAGGAVSPRVKEIAPQQRVLLEEIPGVWPDAANWRAEVILDAGKGNRLRSQLSWR